jgi:hypothetical protein
VEGKELITERQGSEERSEKHAGATLRFKSDRRLRRQIRGSARLHCYITNVELRLMWRLDDDSQLAAMLPYWNCHSPARTVDQSILQLSVDELEGNSCGAQSEDLRVLRGRRIVRCTTYVGAKLGLTVVLL